MSPGSVPLVDAAAVILPPGFTPVLVEADPFGTAVAAAMSGCDAGTVFHAPLAVRCLAAFVLEPDRPIADVPVLRLAAHALHDALASLAPVSIPAEITQHGIRVNGAHVAALRVEGRDGWAVLGIDVAVALGVSDPGNSPDETCLVEEGFDPEDLASAVLAATCRHLLAWFDAWTHVGDAVLTEAMAQ